MSLKHPNDYRTQKAKGIVALARDPGHCVPMIHAILQSQEDFNAFVQHTVPTVSAVTSTYLLSGGPFFARPCPMRPRHGFVDSRVIHTLEDLRQVWADTIAADPDGELIIMRSEVSASASAILTPMAATIAAGHAGATAGVDPFTIPFAVALETVDPDMCRLAGLTPEDTPFIEAVCVSSLWSAGWRLTQLRAGPAVNAIHPNWIPAEMWVETILTPKGDDLLAWEATVLAVSDPTTTVMYHPGGSLIDHWAIHARTRGIAIITTGEAPIIGAHLAPTPSGGDIDYRAVRDGILRVSAGTLPLGTDAAEFVSAALYGLHHHTALIGPRSAWIGIGAGLLLRYGALAVRGEMRYVNKAGPKVKRTTCYRTYASRDTTWVRTLLPTAYGRFRYGWTSSGVGGHPWAGCAKALSSLYNAMRGMVRDPNADTFGTLMRAYNTAINLAHNNGWWLNKFADAKVFTAWTGEAHIVSPLSRLGYIQELWRVFRAGGCVDTHFPCLNDTEHKRRARRWIKTSTPLIKPLPLKTVRIESIPGSPTIRLRTTPQVGSVPGRVLNVPLQAVSRNAMQALQDHLVLIPSGDHYALHMLLPNGKTHLLWEEDDLALTTQTGDPA